MSLLTRKSTSLSNTIAEGGHVSNSKAFGILDSIKILSIACAMEVVIAFGAGIVAGLRAKSYTEAQRQLADSMPAAYVLTYVAWALLLAAILNQYSRRRDWISIKQQCGLHWGSGKANWCGGICGVAIAIFFVFVSPCVFRR